MIGIKARLSLPPRPAPCALHAKLFSLLNREDTIVSFNYDLVADSSLSAVESLPSPPSRGFRLKKLGSVKVPQPRTITDPLLTDEEVGSGFFLKLHGSLDWLSCPSPDCPNHQAVFPLRYWEALFGLRRVDSAAPAEFRSKSYFCRQFRQKDLTNAASSHSCGKLPTRNLRRLHMGLNWAITSRD